MKWADDAANRRRLALANELAALKARRCDGCAHYEPRTLPADVPTSDRHGNCNLPLHRDTPMMLDTSSAVAIYLVVNADHACNAWAPKEPTT